MTNVTRILAAAALVVASFFFIALPVGATDFTEVEDASHIVAEATDVGSATNIFGGLDTTIDDADLYKYTSLYAVATQQCWGVDTELNSASVPRPTHAFAVRNGGIEASDRLFAQSATGDSRGLICFWLRPAETIVIGVGTVGGGGSPGTTYRFDPLRIELIGEPVMAPPTYTLVQLSVRRAATIIEVPSVDLFDSQDPRIPTVEVGAELISQHQRSQADPYGSEAQRGAFHVGDSFAGIEVYATMFGNAQVDCVVLDPGGAPAQGRHKNIVWNDRSYPEAYLPQVASQNGRSDGASCEEPLVPGQTVFFGGIMLTDNGTVRNSDDCDTCVRTPASANPVTSLDAMVLLHYPDYIPEVEPLTITFDGTGSTVNVNWAGSRQCQAVEVELIGRGGMEPMVLQLFNEGGEDQVWSQTSVEGFSVSADVPASANIVPNEVIDWIITPWCAGPDVDYEDQPQLAISGTTSVTVPNEDGPVTAQQLTLSAPYPNPASASTTIRGTVGSPTQVTVRVYDVLGRLIGSPIVNRNVPDSFETTVETSGWSAGSYVVRVTTASGEGQMVRFTVR